MPRTEERAELGKPEPYAATDDGEDQRTNPRMRKNTKPIDEQPSLRDLFAGQALAGIIASERDSAASSWDVHVWADYAFRAADAMLAERKKGAK